MPDGETGVTPLRRPNGQFVRQPGTPGRKPVLLDGHGIRIRDRSVRRDVEKLYSLHPVLSPLDSSAVIRYASLSRHFLRLQTRVAQHPLETDKGRVREIVKELRQTASTLLAHEEALGLTPRSRAALGADLGKMVDLASLMTERDA